MRSKIDAFLFCQSREAGDAMAGQLENDSVIRKVFRLQGKVTERLMPTHILNEISEKTEADYVLLCLKDPVCKVDLTDPFTLDQLLNSFGSDRVNFCLFSTHF